MIDENKISGMIPAKAIGCLGPDDELELQTVIDEGTDFPWNELGKYQTVAALFPLALQLEIPDESLKDSVALRLIKLTEEQRFRKLQEEEALKLQEQIPEDITLLPDSGNNIPEEDFTFRSYDQTEPGSPAEVPLSDSENPDLSGQIQFADINPEEGGIDGDTEIAESPETHADTSSLQDISSVTELLGEAAQTEAAWNKNPDEDFSPREISEVGLNGPKDPGSKPDIGRKSLNEKMYRALEQELETLRSSVETDRRKAGRNSIIIYIIIAVLTALFIFGFFKFRSDIELLEKKIEYLQKKGTAELMYGEKPNGAFFLC